jgi:hypothetical protein
VWVVSSPETPRKRALLLALAAGSVLGSCGPADRSAPGGGGGGRTGSGGQVGNGAGGAQLGTGGLTGGGGTPGGGSGGTITGAGGAIGGGGGTAGTGAAGGQVGTGGGQGGSGGRATGNGGSSGTGGQAGAGAQAGSGGSASGSPWIAFDVASVVGRSNVVLAGPNAMPAQFMPVGNGTLGAAVWAAGGITAQLNRADTLPDRKSIGVLKIPGLARMTGASDFSGRLDLHDAVLVESGGGMTARIYVRADSDELVVDVTGADPASSQTATVELWSPRSPQAQASGAIATLSETWADNTNLGGSRQTFGSLAALTAGGRSVQASANAGTRTIQVAFQPNADGTFRVVCGAPKFTGGTAATVASTLLGTHATAPSADLERGHLAWWHEYWGRVGLVKMTSSDGGAEYVENLRALYLYTNAAESRGALPGSQAGIANLFAFSQDHQPWFPAGYWFWNLRMQVAANLGAGAFDMNAPVYNLYVSNLANIQSWTRMRMGNRAGICVPETMRFNGNGYYAYDGNQSCDQTITPSYNSLTVSSGAEVGLWIWQQYLMTQDRAFLQTSYPIMSESARFLLAFATEESDGLLHTRANAHEQQWNVRDPIPNITAMRALFPAVIAAAQTLGTDTQLVTELQAAIPKIPPLPRTNSARNQVLTPSSDAGGTTIFAYSAEPTAASHNVENDDLEPVWPYNLVGDASSELAVARRTYMMRAYRNQPDWTFDPIHAARIGLPDEVLSTLRAGIGTFQVYPSGLAAWDPADQRIPYIEHLGVLATAVNEALAQDYDGLLRIAPAWPTGWSVSGTVYLRGRSKVHVHFQSGALAFAVLDAGSTGTVDVRNPWSGQATAVIDAAGQQIVAPTTAAMLAISAQQGRSYLIKRSSDPAPAAVQVNGTAAATIKTFNSRTIGVRRN